MSPHEEDLLASGELKTLEVPTGSGPMQEPIDYTQFSADVKSENMMAEYEETKFRVSHDNMNVQFGDQHRNLASENMLYSYEKGRAIDPKMLSEDMPPAILTSKIPMNTYQFFPNVPVIPTVNGDIEKSDFMSQNLSAYDRIKNVQTTNQYDLAP